MFNKIIYIFSLNYSCKFLSKRIFCVLQWQVDVSIIEDRIGLLEIIRSCHSHGIERGMRSVYIPFSYMRPEVVQTRSAVIIQGIVVDL